MENHADYNVWKAKYELLEAAHKGSMHLYPELKQEEGGAAPAAAPGAAQQDQPDHQPLAGNLKILVGPPKPSYLSEV